MNKAEVSSEVLEKLAYFYYRSACIRRPNRDRIADEGWFAYRKGTELRLSAYSRSELEELRDLLARAGFSLARPFAKGRQFRQPIYGYSAVQRFLDLVRCREDT